MVHFAAAGQPEIPVEVDDEDHLATIFERARKHGVHVDTVRDQGRTVFAGPTHTCTIMGPMTKTDSNAITRGARIRNKEKRT